MAAEPALTTMSCRFAEVGCVDKAVAVYSMPAGCVCYPFDTEQALCLHHARHSTPLGGMELVRVLPGVVPFRE